LCSGRQGPCRGPRGPLMKTNKKIALQLPKQDFYSLKLCTVDKVQLGLSTTTMSRCLDLKLLRRLILIIALFIIIHSYCAFASILCRLRIQYCIILLLLEVPGSLPLSLQL